MLQPPEHFCTERYMDTDCTVGSVLFLIVLYVNWLMRVSVCLLSSHVQPHPSGSASGSHPGRPDQTVPGHEQ